MELISEYNLNSSLLENIFGEESSELIENTNERNPIYTRVIKKYNPQSMLMSKESMEKMMEDIRYDPLINPNRVIFGAGPVTKEDAVGYFRNMRTNRTLKEGIIRISEEAAAELRRKIDSSSIFSRVIPRNYRIGELSP